MKKIIKNDKGKSERFRNNSKIERIISHKWVL